MQTQGQWSRHAHPGPQQGQRASGIPFLGPGQFGVIQVMDNGGDTLTVRLSGHTWDHRTLVDQSFPLRARAS